MRKTLLAGSIALASLSLSAHAAMYDVEVLSVNDLAQNVFAKEIDSNGNPLVILQNKYRPSIDVTTLDFDNEAFTDGLTDVDAAREGNFNDADYLYVLSVLRSAQINNTGTTQRITEFRSYIQKGVDVEPIFAFDEINAAFNDYSGATEVIVRDSLAGDFFVGTAEDAFRPVTYTNNNDDEITVYINDFRSRGFVQVNGVTTGLPSPYNRGGGSSDAHAINDNFQVAGRGVVSVTDNLDDAYEQCENPSDDNANPLPQDVCEWRFNYPIPITIPSPLSFTFSGDFRAMVWNLAADGSYIDSTVYDLLFEPEEDDEFRYRTEAYDINNAGIAVGMSNTGEVIRLKFPTQSSETGVFGKVATSFYNGQVTELLDRETFGNSEARLINNNNWVAGITTQVASTTARNKLFVKNLDSNEERVVNGFFNSSQATPRDINDNNIIVGEAETEVSSLSNPNPQKSAFMYNIDTDEFTNLNSLIACDSPYTLIDAVGINNNNEITVTARISSPLKNPLGEDILNSDGEQQMVDKAIALKLTPIANGQVEDCNGSSGVVDTVPERKGASFPVSMLVFLTASLVWFRRYNERE